MRKSKPNMKNKLRKMMRHIRLHPNDAQAERDIDYVIKGRTVPSALRRRSRVKSSFELRYGHLFRKMTSTQG